MEKTVGWVSENPRQWTGPNGLVYYFDIKFTDGEVGDFSTKIFAQEKFEEGKTYDVEVAKVSDRGTKRWNIIKPPFTPGQERSSGGGTGKKYEAMTPDLSYRIGKEIGCEVTINIIINAGWIITKDLRNEGVDHCVLFLDGKEDQKGASNALRQAANTVKVLPEDDGMPGIKLHFDGKPVSFDNVMTDAEYIYNLYMRKKPEPKKEESNK